MEDFFKELEDALKGEVSEYEYRDAIVYYRGYFLEQMALGKSETEIINQLGSPRLIARSIIDAHGIEEEKGQDGYYDARNDSGGDGLKETSPQSHNTIMKKIGGILTIILMILLVAVILKAILPLVLIIVPVLLIVKLFQGE